MLNLSKEKLSNIESIVDQLLQGSMSFPITIETSEIADLASFFSFVVKYENAYFRSKLKFIAHDKMTLLSQLEEAKQVHNEELERSKAEALAQKFAEALKKARGL